MPHLISLEHNIFTPRQDSIDNVILTYEVIHSMAMKWKKGMMFKINISKAYDNVRWRFLNKALGKMGFNQDWIQIIEFCIGTPHFSIIVNGELFGFFSNKNGIK